MPRSLQIVSPPRRRETLLTVHVDPLTLPRGHRSLPPGAVHATPRRPSRAQAHRELRRQLNHDTGGTCRP